jgi:hypothetical protein
MTWFWKKEVPKSLVAKLAEVTTAIGGVGQEGYNELDKYHYQRWRDISQMVRGELSKRGIVLVPGEAEIVSEKSVIVTTSNREQFPGVQLTLQRFYDFTDGVETIRARGIGVGEDIRDKALQKADTGALKYMLRDMFLIPNVEDNPEEVADKAEVVLAEMKPTRGWKSMEQIAEENRTAKEGNRKAMEAPALDAPPERIIRAWNSLCKQHGKTIRQRRDYLQAAFDVKTFAELSRAQADTAIVWAASREELETTLKTSIVAVMDAPKHDEIEVAGD